MCWLKLVKSDWGSFPFRLGFLWEASYLIPHLQATFLNIICLYVITMNIISFILRKYSWYEGSYSWNKYKWIWTKRNRKKEERWRQEHQLELAGMQINKIIQDREWTMKEFHWGWSNKDSSSVVATINYIVIILPGFSALSSPLLKVKLASVAWIIVNSNHWLSYVKAQS